ncbi:MAG TPA: hypothetical protein VN229_11850 [Terriglobales bacterium]|nr:hypothetical protein [Terriglobales bacterium]
MSDQSENRSYTAQLVVTWLLVGIPLLWGVLKTLQNAWSLFQ